MNYDYQQFLCNRLEWIGTTKQACHTLYEQLAQATSQLARMRASPGIRQCYRPRCFDSHSS